jgi:CRP/FNR family transcriptional regulator, cyclic AMP receptor protein
MLTERGAVSLLEADPELGDDLSPADRAAAARALAVHVRTLEPGPWLPHRARWPADPVVGILVLDGLLTRDVTFAGRTTSELLGAGDVLRPWDHDTQFEALPFEASWQVHEPVRLAILDARYALAAARWPGLASAIGRRHVRRARGLAFQLAISQLPRVDDRLVVLLWAYAERWGRVSPRGVRVPLALPHRTLATLVGARRPSVTTALTGLARDGLVERTEYGWLLHGDPQELLAARLGADEHAHARSRP